MFVLSLQTLIVQAVESFEPHKYTGNILSVEEFLREENIEKLEAKFPGLFAYLAFHPQVDQPIVDYISAGSLPSDSGSQILVLFVLDQSAKWPLPLTKKSFGGWLEVDRGVHPSYEIIKMLFQGHPTPPLPSIAYFERFTVEREPIFVSLLLKLN